LTPTYRAKNAFGALMKDSVNIYVARNSIIAVEEGEPSITEQQLRRALEENLDNKQTKTNCGPTQHRGGATALVLFALIGFGIVWPTRGSVDSTAQPTLKSEIASLQAQIRDAEAEDAKYSGGLVKALIGSREQTLKQTLAMLEQRDKAWTFGFRLSYTIDGKPFALPAGATEQLPDIDRELTDLAAKIEAQKLEVDRYSGGLVNAIALSTLETMKQTQAMLSQRRLAIQYELPQFLAFQSTSQPAGPRPAAASMPDSPASSQANDWEITSVAARPGESNRSWTRFAWKLSIANRSHSPQRFEAEIEFRDSDGFPVDTARAYDLVVPASAEETFTGEKLIEASQVSRVTKTVAKVGKAR
jgi:hypothetical protein